MTRLIFRYFFFTSFLLIIVLSCNLQQGNRLDIDVSDIELPEVKIERYGKDLFALDRTNLTSGLKQLAEKYPVFLQGDLDDPQNVIQISDFINDPLLISASQDCFKKYPELNKLEHELTLAFKHLKYYYPEIKIPEVFTYISGFDYEHPVEYYGDFMIIALDMYLGPDYEHYAKIGLPAFRIKRLDYAYIIKDCIAEISKSFIDSGRAKNTLLARIIEDGKKLWFLDAMIPGLGDSVKMGYSAQQMNWCIQNESNIWAFLIENEFLYSTDFQVINKFIADGPFTSFFDRESPAQTGSWIGWQIVRKYMDANDEVSLDELFNDYDAQGILTKSKYKPRY